MRGKHVPALLLGCILTQYCKAHLISLLFTERKSGHMVWPGKPWFGSREVNKSWHSQRHELANALIFWFWTTYWQRTELGYFCIDIFRALNWLYDKKMHRIFFFLNTVSNCCCCCWFLIQQQHQHIYLIEGIVGVFALRISCSEWVYPWTMKISLTFTLSKRTAFTASTFTGYLTRSHMLPITLNTHSPGPFAPGKERAQRPRSGKYNNVSWERKQVLAARETQHKYIEWWNGDRTFSTSLTGVPVKLTLTY